MKELLAITFSRGTMYIACAAVSIAGCRSSGENIQSKVEQIGIGSTPAAVEAQLGSPKVTNLANFLGAEKVTWVYREGATVCEIDFILQRTYAKGCRTILF